MVRRSRRERSRLIAAWRRSKLTQRAFAQRHGISYTTFVGWLGKERHGQSRAAQSGVKFAEVTVRAGSAEVGSIEVQLPDGVCIRIRGAAAVEQAAALVKALGKN